ncbi:MAG: hypothetical protein BalsKO_29330 [Balneolaceae bacterium]
MPTDAASLLSIMRTRLKMQEDGVTNPLEPVKAATKTLVEKLALIDPKEKIDVVVEDNGNLHRAKYIRIVNNELIATYEIQKNT